MQRTTALTELDTLLATSPVHPAPLVALLQQLELKRQYSLEMARQLLTNNTFINDEKTFVDNFIARAGHVEAQRRFQVIDASWRCLTVDFELDHDTNDRRLASMKALQAVNKHLSVDEDAPSPLKVFGSERAYNRSRVLEEYQYRRVMAYRRGKAAGKSWVADLAALKRTTTDWVTTVEPLLQNMLEYVERFRNLEQSSPSQQLPSPRSPLPPRPATNVGTSAPKASATLRERSVSRSPSQGRSSQKRSRDSEPPKAVVAPQSDPMDVDEDVPHGDPTGALAEWIDGMAVKTTSKMTVTTTETTEVQHATTSAAPRPFATEHSTNALRSPALPFIRNEDVDVEEDEEEEEQAVESQLFAATQPAQRAMPSTLLSKLQLGSAANTARLREQAAKAAARPEPSSSSSPARPLAPSPPPRSTTAQHTIRIPTSSADGSSSSLNPSVPVAQARRRTTSSESAFEPTSSGSDPSSSSLSQPPPNQAQTTGRKAPLVLVPATQSSNDMHPIEESQEDDESSQARAVAEDEYEEGQVVEKVDKGKGRERSESVLPKGMTTSRSFGELDGEATADLDDVNVVGRIVEDVEEESL